MKNIFPESSGIMPPAITYFDNIDHNGHNYGTGDYKNVKVGNNILYTDEVYITRMNSTGITYYSLDLGDTWGVFYGDSISFIFSSGMEWKIMAYTVVDGEKSPTVTEGSIVKTPGCLCSCNCSCSCSCECGSTD